MFQRRPFYPGVKQFFKAMNNIPAALLGFCQVSQCALFELGDIKTGDVLVVLVHSETDVPSEASSVLLWEKPSPKTIELVQIGLHVTVRLFRCLLPARFV